MPSKSSKAPVLDHRPSYGAAAIASTLVFGLYILTMAPSSAMWDASEYITAAYTFGLPHPPGNPFFVLVGRLVAMAPIAPNVAMRVNLLAALSSAVSSGMWFLITERVLSYWLVKRWQRVVGAAVATLIGATVFTVWNQSVVNEKVYTMSLAFFAVVSWITVLWCDDPDGPRAYSLLVLIGYLIGLGYTNHPAGFLVGPAVAVAVLARQGKAIWKCIVEVFDAVANGRFAPLYRWRLAVTIPLALCLGLTVFAFEPIRSAHFPAINEGEPTGCTTKFSWDCTFTRTTYVRLKANIDREQFGKVSMTDRFRAMGNGGVYQGRNGPVEAFQAPFYAQVGMWWHYFRWQWLRDPYDNNAGLQNGLAVLFLLLGLLGGVAHWKRDRLSFWFFGPLIFTVTLLLIFYMNFKYGYSQSPALGNAVPREVRDRDYFYLWSFSAWSVWVALGLVWLWEEIAAALSGSESAAKGSDGAPRFPMNSWLLASPILLVAIIPLLANLHSAPRSRDTFTRDWAVDLLNSVEPYGILVTNGDNDTFPLWYAQEVEGVRQDVTVAVTSLLNTDWYVRQIIRRPTRPYDAAKGPSIYRRQSWPTPTVPPLTLTLGQADSVPAYLELREPRTFQKDSITAVLRPPALTRDQLLVLRMIHDAYPQRGMYFTSAGYGQQLGLGKYLVQQGVVSKLDPVPPPVSARYQPVQGFGAIDITRSTALWDSVYVAPRTLLALDRWVDRASSDIPMRYVVTAAVLAQALTDKGNPAAGQAMEAEARRLANAARLNEVLGQPKRKE